MSGAKAARIWKELTFSSDDIEVEWEAAKCFVGYKQEIFAVVCEKEIEAPDWSNIDENLAFHKKLNTFSEHIREKFAFVRLFLDGYIDLFGWNWYELNNGEIESLSGTSGFAMNTVTASEINKRNVNQLNEFISKYSRDKMPEFLGLAYDNLNTSYEIYNNSVQFLMLTVSLEAIFNVSKTELRYRIARNIAILLGVDREHSKSIFNSIKDLYDKRSKLVHTGSIKGIHSYDTYLLRYYVRLSLIAVLELGWDKTHLSNELNQLGFGNGPYSRIKKNKPLFGW